MIKFLLILFSLICVESRAQGAFTNYSKNKINATYYVSNSGNDSYKGTITKPFRTIGKATSVIRDGQSIALQRGDTFPESIILDSLKNIKIMPYGEGNAPLINCFNTLSGWLQNGNIWSKQDDNFPDEITNVFWGSTKGILARSPKTSNETALSGTELTLKDKVSTLNLTDGYWTGCEIVFTPLIWYTKVVRVTDFSDSIWTYSITNDNSYDNFAGTVYGRGGSSSYVGNFNPGVGTNYWVQNHVSCVTTTNEWGYNATTKTLYVYSVTEPTTVKASYYQHGIGVDNCNNVSFDGVDIIGAADNSIDINCSTNIVIKNINIRESGKNGIYIDSSKNITVDNNSMINNNNRGYYAFNSNTLKVTNNYVRSCDSLKGWARYDTNPDAQGGMVGQGIYFLKSYNIEVSYNEVLNTGYAGIEFLICNSTNVHHNYVYKYSTNMGDCGGIRTFYNNHSYNNVYHANPGIFKGITVKNNIVDKVLGGVSGYFVYGIYVDEGSYQSIIHNNYSANNQSGIWFSNDSSEAKYNTLISNGSSDFGDYGIFLNGSQLALKGGKNVIVGNTIIMEYADKLGTETGIRIYYTPITNYIDSNKYYFPFGNLSGSLDSIFIVNRITPNVYYKKTLNWWKITDELTYDWGRQNEQVITPSLFVNSAKPRANYIYKIINPSKNNKIVNLVDLPYSDYIKLDGTTPTYPITIKPYEWLVLVRTE